MPSYGHVQIVHWRMPKRGPWWRRTARARLVCNPFRPSPLVPTIFRWSLAASLGVRGAVGAQRESEETHAGSHIWTPIVRRCARSSCKGAAPKMRVARIVTGHGFQGQKRTRITRREVLTLFWKRSGLGAGCMGRSTTNGRWAMEVFARMRQSLLRLQSDTGFPPERLWTRWVSSSVEDWADEKMAVRTLFLLGPCHYQRGDALALAIRR